MPRRLLIFAVLCLTAGASERVYRERRSGTALQKVILLPQGRFTEKEILSAARRFSRSHPQKRLLHLVMATSARDAGTVVGGKGSTDWDYLGWKHRYVTDTRDYIPAAEYLRLGEREGVRIALPGGGAKHIDWTRESPFEISTEKGIARVLHLAFVLAPLSKLPSPYYIVIGFLRTPGQWTAADATKLAEGMRRVAQTRWMSICAEEGWTFATDTHYPVRNLFLPILEPPSLEQFVKSKSYYCYWESKTCQ